MEGHKLNQGIPEQIVEDKKEKDEKVERLMGKNYKAGEYGVNISKTEFEKLPIESIEMTPDIQGTKRLIKVLPSGAVVMERQRWDFDERDRPFDREKKLLINDTVFPSEKFQKEVIIPEIEKVEERIAILKKELETLKNIQSKINQTTEDKK